MLLSQRGRQGPWYETGLAYSHWLWYDIYLPGMLEK